MSDASGHPGKSPHAFMREALVAQSRLREDRSGLILAALASEAAALSSRTGYAHPELEQYFAARVDRTSPAPPRLQPLAQIAYSAQAFENLEQIYQRLDADDPTLAANSVSLILASIRDLGTDQASQ